MQRIITCLNGAFLPAEEAKLPITDRGFRFGDGVFETIRLAGGVPYQWELHHIRLKAGLEALRIPMPPVDWQQQARKLIHQNKATDGFLRISVSRGSGSIGYLPHPSDLHANWAIEYIPSPPTPTEPYRLWLSTRTRAPLSAFPVNHKLAQGVGSTLALLEAHDHQCDEALQLSGNGLISCASGANIFWIKGKTIFTPSLGTGCLNGTMRTAILRLSRATVRECEADPSTFENADAVFLSNSRLTVWPVSAIEPLGFHFNVDHPIIHALATSIQDDIGAHKDENSASWKSK